MIVAVIPTLYHPPTLSPLLYILEADGVKTILLDTKGREPNIYAWWNEGCDQARAMGATEIAVLNDDIIITSGAMPAIAKALRSDDAVAVVSPFLSKPSVADDTSLVYSEGHWWWWPTPGFTGWNFMFKAELPLPRFDEGYQWHGGDNQFEEDVRLAGWKVAGVVGVNCDHLGSYSARKRVAKISPMSVRDRARWIASNPGPGERPSWTTGSGESPGKPGSYRWYKWQQKLGREKRRA